MPRGEGLGEREGALLTSTDHICVGFLRSIQSAHPADPSHQQGDQDPLPHRQEDPSISSQRPPVTPVPALLEGTAALPVQVGGPPPGCHGPGACWGLSLPLVSAGSTVCWLRNGLIFSIQQSLHQTYGQPVWAACTDTCAPHRCQEAVSWQGTAEGAPLSRPLRLHLGVLHGETSGQSLGREQPSGSGDILIVRGRRGGCGPLRATPTLVPPAPPVLQSYSRPLLADSVQGGGSSPFLLGAPGPEWEG